jgi:ribosome-binding factor A
VAEELRHALAETLERGRLHDPDLEGVSVTVTELDISPDLRNATVFIMPLGGFEQDKVLTAMRRAAPYLRGELARAVRLRYVPQLSFQLDNAFDHASHIDEVLHRPEVARDLGPDADDDADNGS